MNLPGDLGWQIRVESPMVDRLVRRVLSCLVLALTSVGIASSTLAAPTLFSGNISTKTVLESSLRPAAASGIASVLKSSPASFTLPPSVFQTTSSYSCGPMPSTCKYSWVPPAVTVGTDSVSSLMLYYSQKNNGASGFRVG